MPCSGNHHRDGNRNDQITECAVRIKFVPTINSPSLKHQKWPAGPNDTVVAYADTESIGKNEVGEYVCYPGQRKNTQKNPNGTGKHHNVFYLQRTSIINSQFPKIRFARPPAHPNTCTR